MIRTNYKFRTLKSYRGYHIVKKTYTEYDTETRRVTCQDNMYGILDTDNWMSSIEDAHCGIRAAIAVSEFSDAVDKLLADRQIGTHERSNRLFNEWSLADCKITREAYKAPTDGDWIGDHFTKETERIRTVASRKNEHITREEILRGQRIVNLKGAEV